MSNRIGKRIFVPFLSGITLICSAGSSAQTAPNAGRIIQELEQPPLRPKADREFPSLAPPAREDLTPGGAAVAIRSVQLDGNSAFSSTILLGQLGDVTGTKLDLAGMRALAEKIAAYYRSHGYPFTRAYIPAQDISQGDLRIQIVEGRYGRVMPGGEPALQKGASRFLRALRPGNAIEAASLERVMLLLDTEPGMRVSPTMAPGAQRGQGDLTANIERVARFGAEIGVDDEGDRYTGMYREKVSAYAYSPFMFGDLITLRGIHTNQNMWLGSLDYERPLNGTGLRGHVGYSHTTYELGGQFEALGASGYASTAVTGVSYPIVRSRQRNLLVAFDYQYESLQDRYTAIGTVDNKHCNCWPLTVQFDNRDAFLGGGLTYGALILTSGTLHLDSALASVDAATARTAGAFEKLNLDVSRLQAISEHVNLMVRYAAQLTNKNLDSSEQFNLGGVYGVRAYPVGEGIGDRGWLLQAELRYIVDDFVPYVLFDAAHGQTNVHTWDSASDTQRSLTGAGLGSRYNHGPWALDASAAWHIRGGRAIADPKDVNPRIWISAGYHF
ncbi:MAG TPA: ShlB/FhaC/HecB family hemolysin secretion/activation protein [Steroidobacteraceae bacterium]